MRLFVFDDVDVADSGPLFDARFASRSSSYSNDGARSFGDLAAAMRSVVTLLVRMQVTFDPPGNVTVPSLGSTFRPAHRSFTWRTSKARRESE